MQFDVEEGTVRRKQEFIDYLKHYRHDWLNHIQVVKGYITLGKAEDAQRYLDGVIIKSLEESKISQLGDPDLAYFLLTYNWRQDRVILDVEIDHNSVEISSIGKDYPYLLAWIKELTTMVERQCDQEDENHLLIVLCIDDKGLIVKVDFEGDWPETDGKAAIVALKEIVKKDQGTLVIEEHNTSQFCFEIRTKSE
jgi:stage 0 sporulation protein B (sporulation initiation phosphotransferase)